MFLQWCLRSWIVSALDVPHGQRTDRHRSTRSLEVEHLEDRTVPSLAIDPTGAQSLQGICACPLCCGGSPAGVAEPASAEYQFSNGSSNTSGALKWAQPGGLGSQVVLTYSFTSTVTAGLNGITYAQIRSTVQEALAEWAQYAPLKFVEVPDSGPSFLDGTGYNAGSYPTIRIGAKSIDGQYGALAYAYYPSTNGLGGDLVLDTNELWNTRPGGGRIDMLEVVTHELGHALGLGHETNTTAVMNPVYAGRFSGPGTAFLYQDDINGIRTLYGSGSGSVEVLGSSSGTGSSGSSGSGSASGSGGGSTVFAGWRDVTVGDFNADGRDDFAARNSSGVWYVALSTGTGFSTTAWATWSASVGWKDVSVGDFNHDGRSDIIGRTEGGGWWVGLSNGTAFTSTNWAVWSGQVDWQDVSVADFNGDGRSDIVGRTEGGGWWVGLSNGTAFTSTNWAVWSDQVQWKDVSVGDFNGDGRSDIVGRTEGGGWWVGLSNGTAFTSTNWAVWSGQVDWQDVSVADFNGDGRSDIIGRTEGGGWWVGLSTGTAFATANWAVPPQVGKLSAVGVEAVPHAGGNAEGAEQEGTNDILFADPGVQPLAQGSIPWTLSTVDLIQFLAALEMERASRSRGPN